MKNTKTPYKRKDNTQSVRLDKGILKSVRRIADIEGRDLKAQLERLLTTTAHVGVAR